MTLVGGALIMVVSLSLGAPRTTAAPLGLSNLSYARNGERAYAMLQSWGPVSLTPDRFAVLTSVKGIIIPFPVSFAAVGWLVPEPSIVRPQVEPQ